MASGNGMSVVLVGSLELFCAYVDPPQLPSITPQVLSVRDQQGLIIRVLVRWQLQA